MQILELGSGVVVGARGVLDFFLGGGKLILRCLRGGIGRDGGSIGVAVSATASAALVMIRAGFDAMSAAVRWFECCIQSLCNQS